MLPIAFNKFVSSDCLVTQLIDISFCAHDIQVQIHSPPFSLISSQWVWQFEEGEDIKATMTFLSKLGNVWSQSSFLPNKVRFYGFKTHKQLTWMGNSIEKKVINLS